MDRAPAIDPNVVREERERAGLTQLQLAARRAALDAQTRVRQRDEERDKRLSRLGVMIVTALAQRDAQIRVFELRAGKALKSLIEEEGLTAREAAEWCELSSREVHRLRRLLHRQVSTGGRPERRSRHVHRDHP